MPAPILATKLYIPPPRPKIVLRARLIERLVNAGPHNLDKYLSQRGALASGVNPARRLRFVKIVPAEETLETGDILEMVSAGLVPATVADSFTADLYTQVFPKLRKNSDIASPPGDIAWAFRKNSPKLAEAVNAFLRTHKQGSLAGKSSSTST